MKKNRGKNRTVKSEAVFNKDALVLDYLNSLLTSAPAMTMESGETHFVRLALDAAWKQANPADAFFNTSAGSENQLSKMEAEALEFENKNLKLKTELASIDSQVLRSENQDLKMEIACLTAQLSDTKSSLDVMTAENIDLKSRIDLLQDQLNTPIINLMDETPPGQSGLPLIANDTAEEDIKPDYEFDDQLESADPVADQQEKPVVETVEQQESKPCEFSAEILQVQVPSDKANQKIDQNVVILSRNTVATDILNRSVRHSSKIIKQLHADVGKHQSQQEQVPKFVTQNPVHQFSAVIEVDLKPEPVRQQQAEEPENNLPDGDPVSKTDALHPVGDVEIDMEVAPDPKVVVRRNVKNYQDLQDGADSADTKAGHTIVF